MSSLSGSFYVLNSIGHPSYILSKETLPEITLSINSLKLSSSFLY